MDAEYIEQVKGMGRDELLVELGKHIADGTEYGEGDLKERALRWLEAKRGRLYEAICAPDRWPAIRKTLDTSNIDDVFTIAWDVWLAPLSGGIPWCIIVKLLLEEGLDNFCDLK